MRAALVVVALLLAGCTEAPETPPEQDAPETAVTVPFGGAERIQLLEGVASWHFEDTSSPIGIFSSVYDPVSQPIAHACVWDEDGPYFNNLHISKQLPHGGLRPGTGAIEVLLDWTEADSLRDRLVLAYKGADDKWVETDFIPRGEPTPIPVGNGTWSDGRSIRGLDLWLCLEPNDTVPGDADWSALPFLGDVSIRIDLLPVQA